MKFISGIAIYLLLILITPGCKNEPKTVITTPEERALTETPDVFAVDLNGDKLTRWKEADTVWAAREKDVEMARSAYLGKTEDPKTLLRYANAYSMTGRVENAIDLLNRGVQTFPEIADFYTSRGENLLLSRQLGDCVDNFWKAGQKMEKGPNKGLVPPTGDDSIAGVTLAYKNYFLMAMAFFCNNDLSSADKFFEVCGDFSTNSDLWARTYYWQYACYSRSGRTEDAKAILKNLSDNMQILPVSKPYMESLKYYKGTISESDLVDASFEPKSLAEAEPWMIRMYAVGVKNLLNNNKDKALNTFMTIKNKGFWYSMVNLAAETELMRLAGKKYEEPEKIELKSKEKKK